MTQHSRHVLIEVFLAIALLVVAGTAGQAEEPGPDDIIHKSIGILGEDCDFTCCYEVADLYTNRYLEEMRKAILASLKANPNVDTVIRQGFGGKVRTLEEVGAFTPRELYAWFVCDTIVSTPAKYRYTRVEIIEVHHISSDTIEYVVRLSGLKIAPSTQEEAFYRVVRQNGQWRIDQ